MGAFRLVFATLAGTAVLVGHVAAKPLPGTRGWPSSTLLVNGEDCWVNAENCWANSLGLLGSLIRQGRRRCWALLGARLQEPVV